VERRAKSRINYRNRFARGQVVKVIGMAKERDDPALAFILMILITM
jgi:hypothetical protein